MSRTPIALSFLLAACQLNAFRVSLNGPCEGTNQCGPGLICLEGHCSKTCGNNADCGGNAVCNGDSQCIVATTELAANGPSISAVEGDGSTPAQFKSRLILRGSNLQQVTTVRLLTRALEPVAEMFVVSADAQTITAELPKDLSAGEYAVQVLSESGAAREDVTLLRGETGPAGPTADATSEATLAILDQRYLKLSGGTLTGSLAVAQAAAESIIVQPHELVAVGSTTPVQAAANGASITLAAVATLRATLHLPPRTKPILVLCSTTNISGTAQASPVTLLKRMAQLSAVPTPCGGNTSAAVGPGTTLAIPANNECTENGAYLVEVTNPSAVAWSLGGCTVLYLPATTL